MHKKRRSVNVLAGYLEVTDMKVSFSVNWSSRVLQCTFFGEYMNYSYPRSSGAICRTPTANNLALLVFRPLE